MSKSPDEFVEVPLSNITITINDSEVDTNDHRQVRESETTDEDAGGSGNMDEDDYDEVFDTTADTTLELYDNNGYYTFKKPDQGFSWVIVVAAFFVQFFVLGSMNNFGILFTQLLDEFKRTKQETAWVGSITYGLMFASGPLATSLSAKIGCRAVAIIGSLIGLTGTLLASFSDSIFKMYLTQGFMFGVGASLCYFPSVIILPQYFYKKLSLANGLVSCGSGVGTMVMGPVINYTIEHYGWRVSVRLTSALMFVVTLFSFIYKPNIPLNSGNGGQDTKRPLFDCSIFQNKAFLAFTFGLFVFMLSYFVPFVHLTQMALEYNIPMKKASLLIGFMSVASTFGRLFFGKLADVERVNRLYVYQIALLGMGVANTLCPVLTTFPSLMVYCAIFGFFEGCYVCQVAVITGDIVGVDRMAIAVGVLFGIKSIPLTLGPPLAGFLYDISNSYQVAFYVAGAIPTLAAIIMFAVPFLIPPPNHPFWRGKFASKQYLISTSSQSSSAGADANNNNGSIGASNSSKENLDWVDARILHYDKVAVSNHQSFASLSGINLMQKKISMKDIGSISSFGSVIFHSPVPTSTSAAGKMFPAKNSSLFVADRLTNV